MNPQPLQRKRTKGFRYPEGARVLTVTRGTVYGNPYIVTKSSDSFFVTRGKYFSRWYEKRDAAQSAIDNYREYIQEIRDTSPAIYAAMMRDIWTADYVACFCDLNMPCHRSVLIELATEWARTTAQAEPTKGAA